VSNTIQPLTPDTTTTTNSGATITPLNCVDDGEVVSLVQELLDCGSGIRATLDDITEEVAALAGFQIIYMPQNLDIKKVHPIYGETCAGFDRRYLIQGYVNITDSATTFQSWGFDSNSRVTVEISYDEWDRAFGVGTGPLPGDQFEIIGIPCDNNPSGFTSALFEVTTQADIQDLFTVSNRWIVVGNRRDFTHLPNEVREDNDGMVFDSAFAGEVDVETELPLTANGEFNKQCYSVDELSQCDLRNEKSEVYGGFYDETDGDTIFFE